MRLADLEGKELGPDVFPGLTGSLEAWSEVAGMLFAPGCEAQSFFLLASFAAPLMSLFNVKEGGAVVSIHGGRRSGKTLALTAAATVWGDLATMTLPVYRGKARDQVLAQFGNLPVICQGMLNRDPLHTRAFMTDFLTGHIKDTPWQTILLTAGGLPLFDMVLAKDEMRPGVEFKSHVPAALIELKQQPHLEYALTSNAGCAGLAYLRYLTAPKVMQWAKRTLIAQYVAMKEDVGFGDDMRFAARAICAVHVAGMIVAELGVLDVGPQRITRWATAQMVKACDAARDAMAPMNPREEL